MSKSIPLIPTWAVAMDILLTVLEDGNEQGKEAAREELREVGRKLDTLNQHKRRGVSHWHEIEGHPSHDWRDEVANDDTRLGYLDWVDARIEGDGS